MLSTKVTITINILGAIVITSKIDYRVSSILRQGRNITIIVLLGSTQAKEYSSRDLVKVTYILDTKTLLRVKVTNSNSKSSLTDRHTIYLESKEEVLEVIKKTSISNQISIYNQ